MTGIRKLLLIEGRSEEMKQLMLRSSFVQLLGSLAGTATLRAHWLVGTTAKALLAPLGKTTCIKWIGAIEPGSLVVFDCKARFYE